MSDLDARDTLRRILAEQGLDDNGATPHSWRCEHPDRYPDYCTCVDDMIDAILASRAASQQAAAAIGWDAAVAAMRYEDGTPVEIVSMKNPYREGATA
ncbi:hypothetical protein [Microbacterium sp. zg-YB36]|uniref:hypothetical protein n=1 Tax=Microbacterium sp. zg-YB36 TaxID=2969407 RepID=UPI00214C306E|nr:hypothetical protein [Microbacterium sp. zg-YB36]MDL5351178.1 hypothetical protein [Microbacterium sp. zg-YB36]